MALLWKCGCWSVARRREYVSRPSTRDQFWLDCGTGNLPAVSRATLSSVSRSGPSAALGLDVLRTGDAAGNVAANGR